MHLLSCANVTSIDPLPGGRRWMSCESGLIYLPTALAPARVFTQRDNLPTNVIEGVTEDIGDGFRNAQLRTNSIFSSGDGDIWVVTLRESIEIDPQRIHATPLAASIIDRVNIDDRDVPPA
jgi:hypothetical protein